MNISQGYVGLIFLYIYTVTSGGLVLGQSHIRNEAPALPGANICRSCYRRNSGHRDALCMKASNQQQTCPFTYLGLKMSEGTVTTFFFSRCRCHCRCHRLPPPPRLHPPSSPFPLRVLRRSRCLRELSW